MKSLSDHTEPLFKDVHEALVYAYNFSHQQYPRSPMSKAILQSRAGRGLGGLDGAAQAGMIRAEVTNLDRLEQAFIVARFAPASAPCDCGRSCCSGKRSNEEWTQAIGILSLHLRNVVLSGRQTTIGMRYDYIARRFLPKKRRPKIDDLAKKHGVCEKTIRNHVKDVNKFFDGHVVNGTRSPGLEERAMTAITDRLEQAGMIGERE